MLAHLKNISLSGGSFPAILTAFLNNWMILVALFCHLLWPRWGCISLIVGAVKLYTLLKLKQWSTKICLKLKHNDQQKYMVSLRWFYHTLKLKQWSTKICLKDDFSTQLVITQTETIINKICLWGGFTTLSTRWNYQQMHGIFEMTLPHIWWSPWPWIGDGIGIETILPHTWWIGDH